MGEDGRALQVALDMWRAERAGPPGLARRQHERLAALVAHARARSPFFQRHYRELPTDVALGQLPPVRKPELMASFDDWVCDRAITRVDLEAFLADPTHIGARYRGAYFVCRTSGTTGTPGLFVHDRDAVAVYQASALRIDRHWLSLRQWASLVARRFRWAVVVATGAHFAASGWIEHERRRSAWRSRSFRTFSVQRPLAELVAEIDAFAPAMLTAYPSVLELLADERAAGRLRARPMLVETGGESMTPEARARVGVAFGCPVRDVYGASEFDPLAFDCDEGWLHYSSDWAILEPVEENLRPTPPGQASHTVLLTNLANRVQPIVRYDLGDSVTLRPDPCPCGCPLPAFRVAGRQDDVLRLAAADGATVRLPPPIVVPVLESTVGVLRAQVVQTGPASVRLRMEPRPGADAERVWQDLTARVHVVLATHGLAHVEVVRGAEPPERSASGGKFRQVITAPPRLTS